MAGLDVGTWLSATNIDNTTKARSYATNTLYLPIQNRPNLQVLTGAFVSKIITLETAAGAYATGVEYFVNSTRKVASLNQGGEAIVSAG